MRIMAIDYGDAHTGIAISDPTGFLAGFTTTINAYRPEAVADQVASLAREHGVEELVLGYPKNMDGTLGPRAEKAQAMGELLKTVTGLPVTLWVAPYHHRRPPDPDGSRQKRQKAEKNRGRRGRHLDPGGIPHL